LVDLIFTSKIFIRRRRRRSVPSQQYIPTKATSCMGTSSNRTSSNHTPPAPSSSCTVVDALSTWTAGNSSQTSLQRKRARHSCWCLQEMLVLVTLTSVIPICASFMTSPYNCSAAGREMQCPSTFAWADAASSQYSTLEKESGICTAIQPKTAYACRHLALLFVKKKICL
jgi:hypothetical protein